jgi:predicted nucleic acid-binding protein
MIVLDASAAVELLLQTTAGLAVGQRVYSQDEPLHGPHLLDLEVAQALRRSVQDEKISAERAAEALTDLQALRLLRHPHHPLVPRIWELRHNLTAYDAAYVALAERLDATLLTRDRRLSTASGHHARVELI